MGEILLRKIGFFLRKNKEDKSSPHHGIRIFPSEKQGGFKMAAKIFYQEDCNLSLLDGSLDMVVRDMHMH